MCFEMIVLALGVFVTFTDIQSYILIPLTVIYSDHECFINHENLFFVLINMHSIKQQTLMNLYI